MYSLHRGALLKGALLKGALSLALAVTVVTGVALAKGTNEDRRNQTNDTQPVQLQGKGRQASEFFTLQPGLAVVDVTHDGTSNYVIRLLDRDGNAIDTLFNEIGDYNGQRGFFIEKAGQYLLDVAADGNWTAQFRQPRPTEGQTLPRSLEGKGPRVTPFLQLNKGLVIFKLQNEGDAQLRVTLRNSDGQPVEEIVNVLGEFTGSKPINIQKSGIYFLNVSGNGNWTIDVQ